MNYRAIDTITTTPPLGPGFAGPYHSAAAVVAPGDFEKTDPFFVLMDDRMSKAGPMGEAHPHAGLETVTFLLNGTTEDLGGRLEEGDVEWMTAGSGIVHSEETVVSKDMQLFQLWLILPEDQRNVAPRVQVLRRDEMPVRREPGVLARVYSGRSGAVEAHPLNAVPVTLVDIRLEPGAVFEQDLPSSYNGFLVVLDGQLRAGEPEKLISAGQVGWTYPLDGSDGSILKLAAGETGARVLLYAGQPQRIPIAARGPFIAGSEAQLAEYFAAYRAGKFARASSMRPIARGAQDGNR